jgi:hypothetical protein
MNGRFITHLFACPELPPTATHSHEKLPYFIAYMYYRLKCIRCKSPKENLSQRAHFTYFALAIARVDLLNTGPTGGSGAGMPPSSNILNEVSGLPQATSSHAAGAASGVGASGVGSLSAGAASGVGASGMGRVIARAASGVGASGVGSLAAGSATSGR